MLSLRPEEVASIEEYRQALSISEVSLESEAIAGGWMSYSGPGCWSNQACGLGLNGPVGADDIERLVVFFRERGAQPMVAVCPSADPSLPEALADRGFHADESRNILARDLAPSFRETNAEGSQWPPELEVRPIHPHELQAFIEVSTCGFHPQGEDVPEGLAKITRRVVEHPRCAPFLALWEGTPVGGGLAETLDNLACLIGTSVLPDYRRRGVQTALMWRRLEYAAQMGASVVTVMSLPGVATERNAKRLGFEPVYSQVVWILPTRS